MEWNEVLVDGLAVSIGAAAGDELGSSVSLSGDGRTLVVGAPYNDDNGSNKGHVRVYKKNASDKWIHSDDIEGDGFFGWSVSLSNNGNILAIGGNTGSNGNCNRVYQNNSIWDQKVICC